jgi:hypothetical protein
MYRNLLVLLVAAPCIAAPSKAQSAWTYVPASREVLSIGTVVVPYEPGEDAITLVSDGTPRGVPIAARRAVLSFDLASPPASPAADSQRSASEEESFPEDARWPDAKGEMLATLRTDTAEESAGIRNPWEVRARPKATAEKTTFFCGGIISGGAGAVAILNGRVVKKGDALGGFRVARVLASGVLLERGGLFYVLPRGRRVTVITAGG